MNTTQTISKIKFSRFNCNATPWTFSMGPVSELLGRYIKDPDKWVDPFAGKNSPAKYTNDINKDRGAMYCLDAQDFADIVIGPFEGVLFDPPYSYRQISEHYKEAGKKANKLDTSYNFYTRVMNLLDPKLPAGAIAISFGWNTTGFTKKRGWEKLEIMLIAHGAHHNDTLVTVEVKT